MAGKPGVLTTDHRVKLLAHLGCNAGKSARYIGRSYGTTNVIGSAE